MSLSIAKRERACLYFIRSGFDSDKTVSWALKEYAHDDSFINAKRPERLALNTITMGGSGDQREMNSIAFRHALNQHIVEQRESAVSDLEGELLDQKREIKLLREQRAADHVTERTMNDRISALQEERNSLTRELTLEQLPASVV